MDRSDLRARVRTLTGVNSTALRSDADINTVVNEVYLEVCDLSDWPFLYVDDLTVDTVASTATVAMPAAMRSVSGVVLDPSGSNHRRLHQVPLAEIDRLEDRDEGVPEMYAYKDDRTLLLWPTPDDAYDLTIRGWSQASEMDDDSDEPVFDSEYHPIVAYGAAARLLGETDPESVRIDRYTAEAQGMLARMVQRFERTHDRGSIVMGGRADRRRRWHMSGLY